MSAPDPSDGNRSRQGEVTAGDVAKGTAVSFLARAGGIIELVAQPIYARLFGVATYGLYAVLWSAVSLLATIVDFGQTAALPRTIPQAQSETRALQLLKTALLLALTGSVAVAVLITVTAASIATALNAADQDVATLPYAIALFAWAIPLWTLIEVMGAAVRARRAFGPEVRIKIVYEQITRLLAAIAAFFLGWSSLGLVAAHLFSLAVAAALSVHMLAKFYDLRRMLRVPICRDTWGQCLSSGLALMPANLIKRSFSDLPVVVLNLILPGADGAKAAALYAIARKVASVLQLVQMSFSYVLAPLASAQAAAVDIKAVQPLYAFATRLTLSVLLPLAAGMLCIGVPILKIFSPEAALAYPVLMVLLLGRALEATLGPGAAILDVLGKRTQPLLNALAGLILMAVLAAWLTPSNGAFGMALGVALGLLLIGALAQWQLMLSHGIHPYDNAFVRAFGGALLGAACLVGVYLGVHSLSTRMSTPAVLIFVFPAIWIAMRTGLAAADRAALGRAGQLIKLN
jgi:O-antigen/teichoic acid export membrane protein